MIVYYRDNNGLTFRMDPNNKPIAIMLTEDDKFNISHMGHQTIYSAFPDDCDPEDIKAWLRSIKDLNKSATDDWFCPLCEVGFADQDITSAGLECPRCSTRVLDADKYIEYKKNELCASSPSHEV